VLDGDPVPQRGGGAQRPNFGPKSVVAKRSPVSATAEHFFHYRIQTVNYSTVVVKQELNEVPSNKQHVIDASSQQCRLACSSATPATSNFR